MDRARNELSSLRGAAFLLLMLIAMRPIVGYAQVESLEHYVVREAGFDSDGTHLDGRMYAPLDTVHYPVVVLISGSGNESELGTASTIDLARAFARAGIGAYIFDRRGVGKSGGIYSGSDFEQRSRDAIAAVAYLRSLPSTTAVGIWGISQAGWVMPEVARAVPNLAFFILVSPAGVNPYEQVAYFLQRLVRDWGLTPAEVRDTDRMHRAVTLYYAGKERYAVAQRIVDGYRNRPWFKKVVTHPYWDEMTPDGRLLMPSQLAEAKLKRPDAFELVSAASSFANYDNSYDVFGRSTLVIYGGADALIPVGRSQNLFEAAFARNKCQSCAIMTFVGGSHDIVSADNNIRRDYLDAMVAWANVQLERKP